MRAADITDLLQRGLLRKNEGGGRSTSYSLAEETPNKRAEAPLVDGRKYPINSALAAPVRR